MVMLVGLLSVRAKTSVGTFLRICRLGRAMGDGVRVWQRGPSARRTSARAFGPLLLSSFALKRDGSLWAWGGNWTGQLGDGQQRAFVEFSFPLEKLPQTPRPTRVGSDADWVAIAIGAEHVLAQKQD